MKLLEVTMNGGRPRQLCLLLAAFAVSAPALAAEPSAPAVAPAPSDKVVPAPAAVAQVAAEAPTTLSLVVVGTLRPGWASLLREAAKSDPAVLDVKVITEQSRADVTFSPGKTTAAALTASVREKSGMNVRSLRRAVFHVKGELTPNCPVLVRKALERLDGVVAVRASVDQARAWVEFVDGPTPETMVDLVKDRAGLEMVLVSSEG